MGTYTKIKVIMLYTLNNAEYLAYMNSVLALLPPPSGGEEDRPDELSLDKEVQASGAPDIGLSKEFVNAMEKDVLAWQTLWMKAVSRRKRKKPNYTKRIGII